MMESEFCQHIQKPNGRIADGAMGTRLQALGHSYPFESLNLSHAEVVKRVHKEYVDAGATIHLTHTFGAHPVANPDKDWVKWIQAAYENLRSQIAEGHLVLGSIGVFPRADGMEVDLWKLNYREALRAHLSQGPSGVLFETVSRVEDLTHLNELLSEAEFSNLCIGFGLTIDSGGKLEHLGLIEQIRFLNESPIRFYGWNCSVWPGDLLEKLIPVVPLSEKPVFAKFNRGTPVKEGDSWNYLQNEKEWSKVMKKLLDAGFAFVGGCCGVGPDGIKMLQEA